MPSIANNRQSLLDIALAECGTVEAAVSIAAQGDLAITEDLTSGQVLNYQPKTVDKAVLARLQSYGANPATALSPLDLAIVPFGGIGLMAVEIDFCVSLRA